MSNEDQYRPITLSVWKILEKILFEPHQSITEIGSRREARLMSIINLLFALFSLASAVTVFLQMGLSRNVFLHLGLSFIAVGAYILARTRFHKIGSYLIVWYLVVAAFVVGDASSLMSSIHTNLILAFLIASISFPFNYMVIFVIVNIFTICLMPFVYPQFNELGVLLGTFIPFSLLTLTVVRHRDNVENERLKELKEFNEELSLLRIDLENRVEERTVKLEERARQLQVVTEVARTAASFQDLERLLNSSTRLISESFGYYHVGIFLIDNEGQFAVLQAVNSEGGRQMQARKHKLPIDLNSIVGYTAKTQSPRIALDTGADSVYFDNPDLPKTRSEMAIPLKVGMRLIGILDVQSVEKEAFSEEDIAILSTLGDQLAVAMDNTRLLSETRRALVNAEQTYQRYFSQAWSQFADRLNLGGYRYQNGIVAPIIENTDANEVEGSNESKLSIPLMVRGQSIGKIDIQPTHEKQGWTPDEITLLEVVAERAALSLENSRLLEEAQRRAARERVISETTARMRESMNVESVLRNAAQELHKALGNVETEVWVGVDDHKSDEQ
jgi:GAF domain-containing protein